MRRVAKRGTTSSDEKVVTVNITTFRLRLFSSVNVIKSLSFAMKYSTDWERVALWIHVFQAKLNLCAASHSPGFDVSLLLWMGSVCGLQRNVFQWIFDSVWLPIGLVQYGMHNEARCSRIKNAARQLSEPVDGPSILLPTAATEWTPLPADIAFHLCCSRCRPLDSTSLIDLPFSEPSSKQLSDGDITERLD